MSKVESKLKNYLEEGKEINEKKTDIDWDALEKILWKVYRRENSVDEGLDEIHDLLSK